MLKVNGDTTAIVTKACRAPPRRVGGVSANYFRIGGQPLSMSQSRGWKASAVDDCLKTDPKPSPKPSFESAIWMTLERETG